MMTRYKYHQANLMVFIILYLLQLIDAHIEYTSMLQIIKKIPKN